MTFSQEILKDEFECKKCLEFTTKHEAAIFQYNNARPHIVKLAKNYLEKSG